MATQQTLAERAAEAIGAGLSCTCGDTPQCPSCSFDEGAAAMAIHLETHCDNLLDACREASSLVDDGQWVKARDLLAAAIAPVKGGIL